MLAEATRLIFLYFLGMMNCIVLPDPGDETTGAVMLIFVPEKEGWVGRQGVALNSCPDQLSINRRDISRIEPDSAVEHCVCPDIAGHLNCHHSQQRPIDRFL